MWSKGYFRATVGTLTEKVIKEYIEGQHEEADDKTFKIVDEASDFESED